MLSGLRGGGVGGFHGMKVVASFVLVFLFLAPPKIFVIFVMTV